jgi:hypothetical protein
MPRTKFTSLRRNFRASQQRMQDSIGSTTKPTSLRRPLPLLIKHCHSLHTYTHIHTRTDTVVRVRVLGPVTHKDQTALVQCLPQRVGKVLVTSFEGTDREGIDADLIHVYLVFVCVCMCECVCVYSHVCM